MALPLQPGQSLAQRTVGGGELFLTEIDAANHGIGQTGERALLPSPYRVAKTRRFWLHGHQLDDLIRVIDHSLPIRLLAKERVCHHQKDVFVCLVVLEYLLADGKGLAGVAELLVAVEIE